MAAPFSTIALDTETWDMFADASGNIASRQPPDAVAQDMASACRLFEGEYIFNAAAGVPYNTILGHVPSMGLLKADFIAAALTVPGTSNAKCFITSFAGRRLTGQVQADVINSATPVAATFGTIPQST